MHPRQALDVRRISFRNANGFLDTRGALENDSPQMHVLVFYLQATYKTAES